MGSRASATPPLPLYLGFGLRGGLRGLALLTAVGLTAAWALLDLAFALTQAPVLLRVRRRRRRAARRRLVRIPAVADRAPRGGTARWRRRNARARRGSLPVAAALVVLGVARAGRGGAGVHGLRRPRPPGALRQPRAVGLRPGAGRAAVPQRAGGRALEHQAALSGARRRVSSSISICSPMRCCSAASTRTSGACAASSTRWCFRWSPCRRCATATGPSAIALSRRVVFHSTALMASGVYLLFMAAAGYYVRYFGGELGARRCRSRCCSPRCWRSASMAFSGSLRAKLRVFVSKHFFSYRYDYRDEWLRFTQALSARGGQPELGQDVIKGLADLLESPAGASGCGTRRAASSRRPRAGTCRPTPATEPADSAFIRFLRDTRLGRESRGVSLVARALPRTAASALAVGTAERLAHRSADERRRADRLRDPRHRAHARRRQLGGERSAEDRGAPGGDLSRPDAGDRGAARGAQVRRLQPHVGVRRPRSQEHRRAAVADAEERRAPSRQSRSSRRTC